MTMICTVEGTRVFLLVFRCSCRVSTKSNKCQCPGLGWCQVIFCVIFQHPPPHNQKKGTYECGKWFLAICVHFYYFLNKRRDYYASRVKNNGRIHCVGFHLQGMKGKLFVVFYRTCVSFQLMLLVWEQGIVTLVKPIFTLSRWDVIRLDAASGAVMARCGQQKLIPAVQGRSYLRPCQKNVYFFSVTELQFGGLVSWRTSILTWNLLGSKSMRTCFLLYRPRFSSSWLLCFICQF